MNKRFGYVRLLAKSISLPFVVLGVYLFLVQILPTYVGRGFLLWIFLVAGLIWSMDTLWNMWDDLKAINIRIK
jgi:hypothetical protein